MVYAVHPWMISEEAAKPSAQVLQNRSAAEGYCPRQLHVHGACGPLAGCAGTMPLAALQPGNSERRSWWDACLQPAWRFGCWSHTFRDSCWRTCSNALSQRIEHVGRHTSLSEVHALASLPCGQFCHP